MGDGGIDRGGQPCVGSQRLVSAIAILFAAMAYLVVTLAVTGWAP
jgi:hypothetical protein